MSVSGCRAELQHGERSFYMCIAAPCVACAASPTASDIGRVRVDRADEFLDRALEAQRQRRLGDELGGARADHVHAEHSSYFFSATIFTKPSVSLAILARPSTPNGNVPTRTS
jgi:hypothetical protein